MTDKTIKQEIQEINTKLDCIDNKIQGLNSIEIKITNGHEQTIIYKRTAFFQMLYDRKNVWKEKARISARDIILFGGVLFLILDRIIGIVR